MKLLALGRLLAVLAVVALCGSQAHALSIAVSDTYTGRTNFGELLQVPQFDPGIGPLVSVTVEFSGSLERGFGYENFNRVPVTGSGSIQINQTLTLALGANDLLTLPASETVPIVLTAVPAYDGLLDFGGTSGAVVTSSITGPTAGSYVVPIVDFGLFTGLGVVSFDLDAIATSVQNAGSLNGVVLRSESFGSGTVTVTYEFVPEPSTAVLLALGLLGTAARRRS